MQSVDAKTASVAMTRCGNAFRAYLPAQEIAEGKALLKVEGNGFAAFDYTHPGKTSLAAGQVRKLLVTPAFANPELLPNCYVVSPGETLYIPVSKAFGVWGKNDVLAGEGAGMLGAMGARVVWEDVRYLLNGDGNCYWSWHIWATDYDPDAEGGTVDFNGYTLMNRNLGALANDNSTTDKILASYGLYYQWGRKDPFIGPNTYQGSEGSGASMYSGSGSRVYLKMTESSAETGTMEYAIRNPLVFITGVADTDNDWLWSGRSDQLWSADDNVADKSVNDPCPYGWRVAPSGAFDNLAIVGTPAVGDEAKYGWTLTDGNAESFFIGAGRRRYDNGKILNIYNPLPKVRSDAMEAQPWEGLYWTTAVSRTQAAALHFWFEKLDTSAGIENSVPYARANGLQVRCVKQQGR